jgi:uracil-DNA glycosylase family 4
MRVNPSGSTSTGKALFGEAPGFEEQQDGRPFVGKAGKELWAGMKRFCGLTRDDFYVSNIVKEGLPKNRDPKPHEIAAALPEFLDELELVQPQLVITAGGFATRAVLGRRLMSDVHGIPHQVEIAGRSFVCHPIYHPAAGLHNKGFLAAFAYDLDRLGAYLRGELPVWAPTSRPACSEWFSDDAKDALRGLSGMALVAVDTEGWADLPWGLSFSVDGFHGYVIRADDTRALRWFRDRISRATVVMHNGVHDVPVLRAMGIEIEHYHDTQVLAYHRMLRTGCGVLEAESQNLGTLAYRECGMVLGELKEIPGVDLDARIIPYTDDVMLYAGADPVATFRLFAEYQDDTDYAPYQIDMGQVSLVRGMIDQGIPFDVDAALDYYAEVLDKLERCTERLQQMAARYGKREFNPGSHPQVREIITRKIGLRVRKRTKGGLASTNEKALADFKDHPFVSKLQEHRELVKLKGTYAEPLLEELQ